MKIDLVCVFQNYFYEGEVKILTLDLQGRFRMSIFIIKPSAYNRRQVC